MSDLAIEMQMVFGIPPLYWACPILATRGWWVINTFALERALEQIKQGR
jgi:hypothetical protein